MGLFSKREKAQEDKFAHDEEMIFRAKAQAAGLLALWAAEKLGRSSEAAANYADEIVSAKMKGEQVVPRIKMDLDIAEMHTDEEELEKKFAEFVELAKIDLGANVE